MSLRSHGVFFAIDFRALTDPATECRPIRAWGCGRAVSGTGRGPLGLACPQAILWPSTAHWAIECGGFQPRRTGGIAKSWTWRADVRRAKSSARDNHRPSQWHTWIGGL